MEKHNKIHIPTSKRQKKENITGWLMIGLPIIGFILFELMPMIVSGVLSFMELRTYNLTDAKWVGFSNFIEIFNDPYFYKSLLNTLYYCVSVIISLILGLIIAVLLSGKIKGKRFYRTIYFIPYVCSVVAVSYMWQLMYEPNYGILNSLFTKIGLEKVLWLRDPKWFMPSVIIMQVWCGTGFYIILYQAAISKVKKELYEAAEIEGANGIQKFFHVTFPLISPTTFYLLVVGTIGGLQAFAQIQVLANGGVGPDYSGLTVVYYIYIKAFERITTEGMGIASAASWITAILIMGITFINFKIQKYWVNYD